MCGRYYRKADKQKIAEAFHANVVEDGTPSPPWDYNVAPTTIQPIIRNNRDTGARGLVSLRWGLVPFFTKDIKEVKGISTINARADTISTSRTYREPFKKRRCLVPASGFYEWRRIDSKNKQPFAFDLVNGKMMAFAGLYLAALVRKLLPHQMKAMVAEYISSFGSSSTMSTSLAYARPGQQRFVHPY